MSGKCVSITAIVLLVLGCLVGISVILFQEDTSSDPSIPIHERSYRPNWESEPENSIPSRNSNSAGKPTGKTAQVQQESARKNGSVNSRRRPVLNSTLLANVPSSSLPSSPRPPPGIPVIPISLPSTIPVHTPPSKVSSTLSPIYSNLESWPLQKKEEVGANRRGQGALLNQRPSDVQGDMRPWEDGDSSTISVYDNSYSDEDEVAEDFEEDDPDWESSELNELLDLASRLYTSNINTSDFQGFLQTGPHQNLGPAENSISVGRNAYESSLTAFAFMSFGVFLLKQIHNLIGKGTTETVEGRHLGLPSFEETDLNLLFNPPPFTGNGSTETSSKDFATGDTSRHMEDNPTEMNNMFRAMLNLVNAYTKDSQALECIWASYCEDLDKTSANEGLYGIAARINSIGLRLIMHQISAELTLDVMLRSLLGWDGLPCKKMFPQCDAANATMTLRTATAGNLHLSQMKLGTLQE